MGRAGAGRCGGTLPTGGWGWVSRGESLDKPTQEHGLFQKDAASRGRGPSGGAADPARLSLGRRPRPRVAPPWAGAGRTSAPSPCPGHTNHRSPSRPGYAGGSLGARPFCRHWPLPGSSRLCCLWINAEGRALRWAERGPVSGRFMEDFAARSPASPTCARLASVPSGKVLPQPGPRSPAEFAQRVPDVAGKGALSPPSPHPPPPAQG